MTMISSRSSSLVLAAACTVALGACIALSMQQEPPFPKDDKDSHKQEKSTKDEKKEADNLLQEPIDNCEQESCPPTPDESKSHSEVLDSPTVGIHDRSLQRSLSNLSISPVPSKWESSDDELSIDVALPPTSCYLSEDNGDDSMMSNNFSPKKTNTKTNSLMVLLLCFICVGAFVSPFLLSSQTMGRTAVASRGSTHLTTLGYFQNLPAPVPASNSIIPAEERLHEKTAWSTTLRGCYGPFVAL